MKNLSAISDSDLIELFKSGHEQAFEMLFKRHRNRLFSTIYTIVKDSYIAEDLLQETFIKAIDTIRADKYNDKGKFLPWISRIAHNLAIDYFRKQKRYPVSVIQDESPVYNTLLLSEDSVESAQIQSETYRQLKEMIHNLPDAQKEVLMMRHYMKMSFQEIAELTNVSINTALGRMRYALINLRKGMEKQSVSADFAFA